MIVVTGNNNAVVVGSLMRMAAKVVEALYEVEGPRVVLLNLKLDVLNLRSAVRTRRRGMVKKRHR